MDKWIFLVTVVLFLLSNAIWYASCERFIIIPSPDSPCPRELMVDSCITLQQYIASPSISSNITLDLQPGDHHLNSLLSASNIDSFMMRASTTATVFYNQSFYFNFYQLQHVYINGITFKRCRINMNYITNAIVERNSFVNMSICCYNILSISQSSIEVNDCRFENSQNHSNRAMYLSGGDATILYSNFSGFVRDIGYGGAVTIRGGGTTIVNSYFNNNIVVGRGYGGAAVYVYDGDGVNIINSSFSDNAVGGHGGAIYVYRTQVTIVNSYFSHNEAARRGYGGAAVNVYDGDGVNIINSSFSDNAVGGHGGAIYVYRTQVTIVNSCFSHNEAAGRGYGGAAVNVYEGATTIANSCFSDNMAGGYGGAIYVRGRVTVTVNNCYFRDNEAAYGGSAVHTYEGRATISDSYFCGDIVSGYRSVFAYGGQNSITILNSCFSYSTTESNSRHGRTYYISGSNVTVINTTFIHNTNDTLSENTAAPCRVMDVDELYHCNIGKTLDRGNSINYISC